MNDSLASQQKSKKTGGDVLSARLLYLALKCPLLQGKYCQTETVRPVEPQACQNGETAEKGRCFSRAAYRFALWSAQAGTGRAYQLQRFVPQGA